MWKCQKHGQIPPPWPHLWFFSNSFQWEHNSTHNANSNSHPLMVLSRLVLSLTPKVVIIFNSSSQSSFSILQFNSSFILQFIRYCCPEIPYCNLTSANALPNLELGIHSETICTNTILTQIPGRSQHCLSERERIRVLALSPVRSLIVLLSIACTGIAPILDI